MDRRKHASAWCSITTSQHIPAVLPCRRASVCPATALFGVVMKRQMRLMRGCFAGPARTTSATRCAHTALNFLALARHSAQRGSGHSIPAHTNKTMSRNAGHDGVHTHVLAFGKHSDSLAACLPPLAPSSHLCGITNRPGYHRRGAHTAAQGHNISLKLRRLRPQGIQCACRMDALHASISRLPHLPGSGPGHAITGRTPTARCANIPGRHTHTHTPRSYLGTVLLRS